MLIAFNKPWGVLSQFTKDGSPNRALAEFGFPKNVYPIGRLDADSEGLLLLSDEPELNERLLHPRHAHEREYWAQVEGIPAPDALQKLARGVVVQGCKTLPCRAWILEPQPEMMGEPSTARDDVMRSNQPTPNPSTEGSYTTNARRRFPACPPSFRFGAVAPKPQAKAEEGPGVGSLLLLPPRDPPIRFRKRVPDCWIGLELTEGKNRQVRRMTAAIGHPTLRLVRVRIGGFRLENLGAGEWKPLSRAERQTVLQ